MSKFQAEYKIAHQSFEDFILVIFVLVDDLYQKVAKALLSDSEIITLGFDSEKACYSFVKKNYGHLFPRMCNRSQFNRTRRNLLQVTSLQKHLKTMWKCANSDERIFVRQAAQLKLLK